MPTRQLLLVALALSGCMVGPDFTPPPAPVAEQWTAAGTPTVDTERQQYRDWWAVLNDPVLTRLVETAYRQNLTLLSAGVRVLEARAQLGLAIGELYPQLQQVSAQTTYNRIPGTVPHSLIENTYSQAVFGAQTGWELDLWGKLRRGIESADQAYLASVAEYDDVLVTLTADIASNYVRLRTLETQLALARENIVRQEQALAIARARFRAGVVTRRDVYQAENVLGATAAAVPSLSIALAQAKSALMVLLGLPPGPMDDLLRGASGIPVAPELVAVGIPADLLRRRPDVRKAELQAAAQCAQIGFSRADLLPAVTLLGNVGTVASNVGQADLGRVFTADSLAYSMGPTVQWNVLHYGRISNAVRVQDARFQRLIVDYQAAVVRAQHEVETGIAQFAQSRERARFLAGSVEAARGALAVSLLQYKEGTADFTTVLNAEQNLYQTQNDLALAEGDVVLGLIGAYRALGGGWQLREGHDFVPAATREEMVRRTNWGPLLNPERPQPGIPGLPSTEDTGPLVRPPEW